ncbi:MAG TPA: hypothetical protein VG294_09025 [Solirubrobacteraceae bacterium]|jgi:phosphotriesterase-related protein|nr:hypothetical protein [Solirubrobacteraceae bacterium]
MSETSTAAVLRTVEGDVPADSVGITLAHEHVQCDSSVWLNAASASRYPELSRARPALENLWWMRQFPNSNADILRLDDPDLAVQELAVLAEAGGGALIDVTPIGLGRDVAALRTIAERSRVRIVSGTGFYVAGAHPEWMKRSSEAELAELMTREIVHGVGDTGIRCGVIGELGVSEPLHDRERRVLRAAARVQRATGAAISIHTAAHAIDVDSALTAADILQDAGADLSRVVMGHLDTSLHRPEYHEAVAARGCMVEYDLFGHEFFESENGFQSFGDTETCRAVARMVTAGLIDHLLLSHDICYKIQLQAYGGYGYAHLLRNIVPRLELLGIGAEQLRRILVENPRRIFAMSGERADAEA